MPARTRTPATIALLSDFGYRDHYAGVMKGVIARIAPQATLIDLTHGIPAQSIMAGAIVLAQSWRYFPAHTIFLVVVDPGVGTARRAIAVETISGARFVGPDNGVLALAVEQAGMAHAAELRADRFRLATVSSTFHGRDIFAPAAAYLARGEALSSLGPRLAKILPLRLPNPTLGAARIGGEVIYIDGFGNLITNIARADTARLAGSFPEKSLSVRIGRGAAIKIYRAYGDAPADRALATFGSFDLLEIAVRDSSAAASFGAHLGAPVSVTISRGR